MACGPIVGFGLVIAFWPLDRTMRVAFWVRRQVTAKLAVGRPLGIKLQMPLNGDLHFLPHH
jgi:hypothetical protein